MATSDAPLEIGRLALTVNDIGAVSAFYQRVLGLQLLSGDGETALLGAGERPLIELRADPAARRRGPREAGLFHTAFLLPDRRDLGAWLQMASETRVPVAGASDHGVSEAIYLSDPEGNGIEIYTDRPRDSWRREGDGVAMITDPLDFDSLLRAAEAPWRGAPEGTVIGHVHLQVGAIPEAEAFYAGQLGLTLTARYQGGSFFASGGYHHHLAANIWNSRGAGPRNYPSTGLAELELRADPATCAAITARTGATHFADPWGTEITLTEKEA